MYYVYYIFFFFFLHQCHLVLSGIYLQSHRHVLRRFQQVSIEMEKWKKKLFEHSNMIGIKDLSVLRKFIFKTALVYSTFYHFMPWWEGNSWCTSFFFNLKTMKGLVCTIGFCVSSSVLVYFVSSSPNNKNIAIKNCIYTNHVLKNCDN